MEASAKNAIFLYTTDGNAPKKNVTTYACDFMITKDSSYILALTEKKGIYSNKLEIPIIGVPKKLAQDVSNFGYWGNGDYQIQVKDDKEFRKLGITFLKNNSCN